MPNPSRPVKTKTVIKPAPVFAVFGSTKKAMTRPRTMEIRYVAGGICSIMDTPAIIALQRSVMDSSMYVLRNTLLVASTDSAERTGALTEGFISS